MTSRSPRWVEAAQRRFDRLGRRGIRGLPAWLIVLPLASLVAVRTAVSDSLDEGAALASALLILAIWAAVLALWDGERWLLYGLMTLVILPIQLLPAADTTKAVLVVILPTIAASFVFDRGGLPRTQNAGRAEDDDAV